jgi:hypothetical protein
MFGNSAKTKKGIAAHLISTLNFVLNGRLAQAANRTRLDGTSPVS